MISTCFRTALECVSRKHSRAVQFSLNLLMRVRAGVCGDDPIRTCSAFWLGGRLCGGARALYCCGPDALLLAIVDWPHYYGVDTIVRSALSWRRVCASAASHSRHARTHDRAVVGGGTAFMMHRARQAHSELVRRGECMEGVLLFPTGDIVVRFRGDCGRRQV